MDTIQAGNDRAPVDAKEIKQRWKGYMYKNNLNEPDDCDDMVSQREPDMREREIKQALGVTAVNKAGGGDGIPGELLKTLDDDATKLLHSLRRQIWKTQQWPQDWKRSTVTPVPKKTSTKVCSNPQTVVLISHDSKVMLKILHARLQHYVNQELTVVQTGFRKGRGIRD